VVDSNGYLSEEDSSRLRHALGPRMLREGLLDLPASLRVDMNLRDVQQAVYRFGIQYHVFEWIAQDMPCVIFHDERAFDKIESLVPLDILPQNVDRPFEREVVDRPLNTIAEDRKVDGLDVEFWPRDFVAQLFSEWLFRFLEIRISFSSRKRWFRPPPSTAGPGLAVTVNTLNHGLKVLCSPVMLLRRRTAFGNSLSTPVTGHLHPGIYVFGAEGPAIGGTRWENNHEPIPPNFTINTVQF
jgi:hypothetical protein